MTTPIKFADQVRDYLRENLTVEVNSDETYTGGMGGGPLYATTKELVIRLEGDVIASTSL